MPGYYLNPVEIDSVNDLTISTGVPYSFSSPEIGVEDMAIISYLVTEVSSEGSCDYGDSGDNIIFSTRDEYDAAPTFALFPGGDKTYYDITIKRLTFRLQIL